MTVTVDVEQNQYDDILNGNPVQLRTTIPAKELDQFKKGEAITVVCSESRLKARVVSQPIKIVDKAGDKIEISLEVTQG